MPSMICNSGPSYVSILSTYIYRDHQKTLEREDKFSSRVLKKISLLQGHPQSVKLQRRPETLRYSKCPVFSLTHLYKSDTLYIVVQGITSQTCHVFS